VTLITLGDVSLARKLLDTVVKWGETSGLQVHVRKTKFIVLGDASASVPTADLDTVTLYGKPVQRTESLRHLGKTPERTLTTDAAASGWGGFVVRPDGSQRETRGTWPPTDRRSSNRRELEGMILAVRALVFPDIPDGAALHIQPSTPRSSPRSRSTFPSQQPSSLVPPSSPQSTLREVSTSVSCSPIL
jgi:hypothetical protein